MNRVALLTLALLAHAVAAPAVAQVAILPVVITTVGELPAAPVDGRPYVVVDGLTASDCDRVSGGGGSDVHWCLYDADAGSYSAVGGGASAGDIEAVGDCVTGSCFQATTATHVLAAPVGGGVAVFRALTDADVPNTITVDIATAATSATTATTAATANAGDSATGFFPAGTIEHERGGLEADVSLYAGLVAISGGLTSNVTGLAELNAALGSSIADGAHTAAFTPNADPGVDHSAYVAGHGDGTDCSAGQYARGTDGSGNATGCTPDDAGTDDQTAPEVPYTPTTPTDWVDPDPAHVAEGLDDLAGRLTTEEAKAEQNDLTAAVTWANVPEANIPSEIARDSEVPSLETDPGVPLLALADLGDLCAGGESTRRNVGDTANECYAPSAGGSPAGSDDQYQFNDTGAFGGANAYYDGTRTIIGNSSALGTNLTNNVLQVWSGAPPTVPSFGNQATAVIGANGRVRLVLQSYATGNNSEIGFGDSASAMAGSVSYVNSSDRFDIGPAANPNALQVEAGGVTVENLLKITPQASAPATCSIGDLYVDSSGAWCGCEATNTWGQLNATGSCV